MSDYSLVRQSAAASSPADHAKRAEVHSLPNLGAPLRGLWQHALCIDQHTVIAALGFLCLFAANFMAPTDPDFWWHLRTGQLIVEKDSPIAVLLASQNDWEKVYEGEVEHIFVRRDVP